MFVYAVCMGFAEEDLCGSCIPAYIVEADGTLYCGLIE